ncbi:Ion channel [Thalassoglobus neptunius]|uniref:Ion channel n=1 Tax=Thalassoglobus neptunius TaxID=1938619 RepID=A0A5C5WMN6_9PLAN|nr:potassium channel family protein [Thalassoglobus neptunius]TWT51880.1 Ion channel [Thalassoglobus neptunius]
MFLICVVSATLVLTCVAIHYNTFTFLATPRDQVHQRKRWWINVTILGVLMAHILEMLLFSFVYEILSHFPGNGWIQDGDGVRSEDYWYFSFQVYTSLGFGDLIPVGNLRMMTVLETLIGLVLIAWTASFLFVEMQSWAVVHPRLGAISRAGDRRSHAHEADEESSDT